MVFDNPPKIKVNRYTIGWGQMNILVGIPILARYENINNSENPIYGYVEDSLIKTVIDRKCIVFLCDPVKFDLDQNGNRITNGGMYSIKDSIFEVNDLFYIPTVIDYINEIMSPKKV